MGLGHTVAGSLRKYWQILTLAVLWLATLTTLLIWGLTDRVNAKMDTNRCTPQPSLAGQPAVAAKQPAQLKPRVEPRATVAFYQHRDVTMRRIEYDITDPGNALSGATSL